MDGFATSLDRARRLAQAVADSGERYAQFVDRVRDAAPWRFEKLPEAELDRDVLRVVDHHLEHLIPRVARYLDANARRVIDFGCGSGGSAIAVALVYPGVRCTGFDVDPDEVALARERASLYGVAERCEFHCIPAGRPLPFADGSFDFCLCSSVLEYVIDRDARQFCVREMARSLRPGGLLFCSVPNRLYPFEIHSRKWGWNHFPALLNARVVGSTVWEVKRLARPFVLRAHRVPLIDLLRPWTNFCLRQDTEN